MNDGGIPFSRAQREYDRLEEMPPGLRECVHEFGFAIVTACRDAGVTKPASIRQLVHEIWSGARQSPQRVRRDGSCRALAELDWLLVQAGAEISAATLVRVLRQNSLVVLPLEPSPGMIAASLDAVKHMDRVTRTEKHRNRLRSAINAGVRQFWPQMKGNA